jgi:hypothetical protein
MWKPEHRALRTVAFVTRAIDRCRMDACVWLSRSLDPRAFREDNYPYMLRSSISC